MKALAFTLYVSIVLLFSAFARAEEIPYAPLEFQTFTVNVSEVTPVDSEVLEIRGYLPNRCFPEPNAEIVQDEFDPSVLRMRLTSPIPTNPCDQRLETYSKRVSVPSALQEAQIELSDKIVYTLKVEGSEFQMPVSVY